MTGGPVVSVVIPTRKRPELVVRAVRSALAQTFRELEVIVVIDGPDEYSKAALGQIGDERLRIIALPENVGGSQARNTAVREARGEWIALLDDDDEWLPEKLSAQLLIAKESNVEYPIVASQVIARHKGGDVVWPRFEPTYPIAEYLFVRRTSHEGDALLTTSTLFFPRRLFDAVSFTDGLRKHQDWDWLLRAVRHPGVALKFVSSPLTIWHFEHEGSVSRTPSSRFSLEWAKSRRELFTKRAYAGFIATHVAPQAALERRWGSLIPLGWEMCRAGKPRFFDLLLFCSMWAVPPAVRMKIRNFRGM